MQKDGEPSALPWIDCNFYCHLDMLPSIQGHDSFLVDYDRFCPIIRDYFKKLE